MERHKAGEENGEREGEERKIGEEKGEEGMGEERERGKEGERVFAPTCAKIQVLLQRPPPTPTSHVLTYSI